MYVYIWRHIGPPAHILGGNFLLSFDCGTWFCARLQFRDGFYSTRGVEKKSGNSSPFKSSQCIWHRLSFDTQCGSDVLHSNCARSLFCSRMLPISPPTPPPLPLNFRNEDREKHYPTFEASGCEGSNIGKTKRVAESISVQYKKIFLYSSRNIFCPV